MSNLSVFNRDSVEIIINTNTGESFCSVNGYSRMSGKAKSTISERVEKLVREDEIKEAEIDTGYGLKLVRLIPAKLAFKWALRDNPALAERMGECGATVFFHNLVGYKVTSEAISTEPKSQAEVFLLIAQQMVEQERRTKELESRLTQFEQLRLEAIADLNTLEPPSVNAEGLGTRAKIRRIVADFVVGKGLGYQEVYGRLYREFRDRYKLDLRQRAKNSGKKKPLDIAEELGVVEELYAVANDLFA